MRKLHPDLDFDIFEDPTPQMRANIAASIELLIALLDEIDGDPDAEIDDPFEDDDPEKDDDPAEDDPDEDDAFDLPF